MPLNYPTMRYAPPSGDPIIRTKPRRAILIRDACDFPAGTEVEILEVHPGAGVAKIKVPNGSAWHLDLDSLENIPAVPAPKPLPLTFWERLFGEPLV